VRAHVLFAQKSNSAEFARAVARFSDFFLQYHAVTQTHVHVISITADNYSVFRLRSCMDVVVAVCLFVRVQLRMGVYLV